MQKSKEEINNVTKEKQENKPKNKPESKKEKIFRKRLLLLKHNNKKGKIYIRKSFINLTDKT